MNLRKLKLEDAEPMLEWMHDEDVVMNLHKDFGSMTLCDCNSFIESSQDDRLDYHMAIVNDDDEYQGTVSLKNINRDNGSAEFGIVVRKCAMGKGYSTEAMKEILRRGFDELYLNYIYWCVSPKNGRALHFYEKNNYSTIDVNQLDDVEICRGVYTTEEIREYVWYKVVKL